MKTILLRACAFLALAASASAEIIGVETFDYPDGAIAGKSGGTFWDFRNVPLAGHTGSAADWDTVTWDKPTTDLATPPASVGAPFSRRERRDQRALPGHVGDGWGEVLFPADQQALSGTTPATSLNSHSPHETDPSPRQRCSP